MDDEDTYNVDNELKNAFKDGGVDVVKRRDRTDVKVKKENFFNQLIILRINDSFGKLVPGCEFKFTRQKLTKEVIYILIKRSPLPDTEIDFFLDSSGSVFYLDELQLKAQTKPEYYVIVPRVKRANRDVRDEPFYQGQDVFIVTSVPNKCKDETTDVDEVTMRAWILHAIFEEDIHSRPFQAAIEQTKVAIKAIQKKIKSVAKLEFREDNGDKMADDKAEAERQVLYDAFSAERMQAEKRLNQKIDGLNKQIIWRGKMGIKFQKVSTDVNTDTSTWQIRLYGTSDAEELEQALVKKQDWAGIKVCAGSNNPKLPPWTGRGRVPDGNLDGTHSEFEPDYSLLQINVAGARFGRVENGVGTFKTLDRTSVPYASDHFEIYYGDWDMGKKNGHGMEVNDSGIFTGRFIDHFKDGHGRWDLADGTTIVAPFLCKTQHEEPLPNAVFSNPYKDGEPDGEVEILFSDGGLYKGMMKNGRITGQGKYESAFGEIFIGTFVNGILHGKNCYVKNHAKEKIMGTFDMGELNGEGKYENERGDSYDGYFENSMKHGRGLAFYKGRGSYRGYYSYEFRSGKGELEYGRIPKPKKEKVVESFLGGDVDELKNDKDDKEIKKKIDDTLDDEGNKKTLSKFRNTFQGFFMANKITSGGIILNNKSEIAEFISLRDKRKCLPIFSVIDRDLQTSKMLRRKVDKYNDMEQNIRAEIFKKKLRIFSQQKHYTKKDMYAQDQPEGPGISSKDMISRSLVRKERLQRVDPYTTKSENALVPRLNLLLTASNPITHLTSEYNLIKPDKELGGLKRVNKLLMRIAASDFEEMKERQRYLKYDQIWARAEEAFVKKKRVMAGK